MITPAYTGGTARAADYVTLELAVRDTGTGMMPEQTGRLFSGSSQGDASTTRQYGGTIPGLAITKRLVKKVENAFSFGDPGGFAYPV